MQHMNRNNIILPEYQKSPINEELEFKFLEDIIYYDGPIISLGITYNNEIVLFEWLDFDDDTKINIYCYAFIKQEDFLPMMNDEKLYYHVLQESNLIIGWKFKEKAYDFEVWEAQWFVENYGPTPTVRLKDDLDMVREKLLTFLETDPVLKAQLQLS